jgi:hypothetical protein
VSGEGTPSMSIASYALPEIAGQCRQMTVDQVAWGTARRVTAA